MKTKKIFEKVIIENAVAYFPSTNVRHLKLGRELIKRFTDNTPQLPSMNDQTATK